MGRTHILCAVAALVVAAAHGPAADDPLRKQALRLNDITGQDAISGKILELIKDKDEVKKLVAAAAGMAKEKEQPFNYNGAYILAKAAYVTKDFDSSLAFYRICADQAVKLKSGQKLVDVYDGLIMLFQDHKKYDEVIKTCEEFLDLKGGQTVDQAKPFVAEKLVLALAKQKKFDDALKMTEKLLSNTDGNWYFNRLKADVLREAGKNEEAIDAFEETIEKLNKANFKDEQEKVRDAMIERCRYVMSGVFTDMGQVDKATEQLRKLLKAHPESSTYNNDLGYVLADNDKDLDEAEKLVRKALDLDKAERAKLKEKGLLDADEDKENAAYLDSLGWVLYKKKNYAEAKKHLLEASKTDEGKHVEIFDHLADVHKAMGEKADAVAVWQKALELEDVSKRDMSRKEAIKKKLAQESGDNP